MAAFNKFNFRRKGSERHLCTDDYKSLSRSSRNENLIMYESTDDSSEVDCSDADSQNSRRFSVAGCEIYIDSSSSTEVDSDNNSSSLSNSTVSEEIRDDETQEFDEENSDVDDKIINANVVASSPVSDEENNLCSGGRADLPPTHRIPSPFPRRNLNLRSENDIRRLPQARIQPFADSVSLFFQYLELEARKLSEEKRRALVNDFQNKLFEMQKGD